MDGTVNHGANAITTAVIREFTPSRIEQQLLAQVFEMVFIPQCREASSVETEADARTRRVVDEDQHANETPNAGRCAA